MTARADARASSRSLGVLASRAFAFRSLGLLACLAFVACSGGERAQRMHLDEPVTAKLQLDEESEDRFELDVPPGLVRVEVVLESEDADLDLAARGPGATTDEAFATCEAGRARLCFDRSTEPPLVDGAWTFRVAWPLRAHPRSVQKDLSTIAFTLRARAFRSREDGVLAEGRDLDGTIERESGGFRLYRVEVPESARALRVDVLETPGDVDLAVGRGPLGVDLGPDEAVEQNAYGRESIVLLPDGDPPLRPGTWFVELFDAHDAESPVPFRVRLRFDAEPAADQLVLPDFRRTPEDEGLGFPLGAVVELDTEDGGGSGALLTDDGWILTNAHVVAARADGAPQDPVVAVTLAAESPPVEAFRARVEDTDEELDLALVRVVAGFHGQALPDGYRFPHLELGDPEALRIGAALRIVGFPDTGGLGTRVTISVTRGIVAGFDTLPAGRVIKTDAEITSGNSGGAAIDATGRLVGVPTSRVENGSGQLGYVHPIAWIPREWRRRMNLGAR